jgi:hypothetical protein
MIPTTKTQITFPDLGSLKEYDFLSSAERSEKCLLQLEALVKESEEKIQRSIEAFRSATKNSLTNITVEAEKLTGRATKNRAASIRIEEAKANEPKRLAILQELLAIEAEAKVMAPVIYSPKQLLMRMTLESDQRRNYLKQIEGANTEELNAYAILAVGEKNMQLASALCQHVGPLPKDQQPGFTANALAEIFVAERFQAIQEALEKIKRNPPMAVSIDRAYRTGERESVAASLTRAAARLQ